MMVCLAVGVPVMAAPGDQKTEPSEGVLSVRAFGAVGDGKIDDAPAFQQALDAAGKSPGTVVRIPVGNYLLKGPIRVPAFTTLEGVWQAPTTRSELKGTTLLAAHGEGDESARPLITMLGNSVLKGVTVFYPGQDDPANIKPYPWCIAGNGENVTIQDCLLVNPYKGIDLGTRPCARHLVQRVYGQPLRLGLFVDQCYDVGRIENVHFWPFWKWQENSPIAKWMLEKSECFVFARTDWEYVFNTFCFGYGVGYKFTGSKQGACNGNFLGIGADAARRAVLVEAAQPYGLLITNGEFVSMGTPDATEVEVAPGVDATIQFSNCAFWGPSDRNALLKGGMSMFNNCHFHRWDAGKQGHASIHAEGGRLVVNGCRFSHEAAQVFIGKGVGSAVVMGNLFAGRMAIENQIGGQAQIGLNVGDAPAPAESARPRQRRPFGAVTRPAGQ